MGGWGMTALRGIVGVCLLGALTIQVLILISVITAEVGTGPFATAALLLVVLAILCLQVVGVSVLRFLRFVRRDAAFTPAAARPAAVVTGALLAGAALVVTLAVLGAVANRTSPGDAIAPGAVALLGGVALLATGVALLVRVLRALQLEGAARHGERTVTP